MAWTQESAGNAWYEDQALTRTAPSSASDGVPLAGLKTISVSLQANSTKTLSGGTLRCYVYDSLVGVWARCTSLDLSVSPTGVRTIAFEGADTSGSRSGARVLWATDSVTVSGGTDVRVFLLGGV